MGIASILNSLYQSLGAEDQHAFYHNTDAVCILDEVLIEFGWQELEICCWLDIYDCAAC